MKSNTKIIPFQNREIEVIYFYEFTPGMIDYPDDHQVEIIQINYNGRCIDKLLSNESINHILEEILDRQDLDDLAFDEHDFY